MNRATIFTIFAVIATIAVATIVYFGTVGTKPALAPENTTPDGTGFQGPTTPPPAGGTESSAPAREIAIRGDEFSFSPQTITAASGERLRLTFANEGNAPHTFDIDELDVHSGIVNPGGSRTIEFSAPAQSVTYRVYCAIPGHAEQGMVGQLIIE